MLTSVLCVYVFQIIINNNVDYQINGLDTRDCMKKEITIIVRFVQLKTKLKKRLINYEKMHSTTQKRNHSVTFDNFYFSRR